MINRNILFFFISISTAKAVNLVQKSKIASKHFEENLKKKKKTSMYACISIQPLRACNLQIKRYCLNEDTDDLALSLKV